MTAEAAAPERAAPIQFDVSAPLQAGTTLLEAGAGTGKTWTIAALVTRLIAEGTADLSELLLVTFGRAATRELRERVRERLTQARDELSTGAGATGDVLLAHLAAGPPEVIAQRRSRLAAAAADFDSATIVTTHRFCQLVIRGLGSAADVDPDTELAEDLGELVREVALDLYLRKWAPNGGAVFNLDEALNIAEAAAGDAHARLVPDPESGEHPAALRSRFAHAVRREVAHRLRVRRAMSFDDLLVRLRDVLRDPVAGPPVADRLRARFRVVLVDEFQDTDPVQWEILRTAFHGHGILVLIGDPKQAIYAFRGGDLHSYLAAAAVADHHAGLSVNWRSDAGVLRGLDALFAGMALGDERITVPPVRAGRPQPLLRRPVPRAPVQLRLSGSDGLSCGSDGVPYAAAAREAVLADLVGEIVELLTDGSTCSDAPGSPERAVSPGDIAVLVRSNSQAEAVREALLRAAVPSVLHARTNVFATAAATDWLVLLEAIEQPHRSARVRRLALSAFVGADARQLAQPDGAWYDALAESVRAWGAVLARSGVAALFAAVDSAQGTSARLLAQLGGERRATDLRHIADVAHAGALERSLGPAALLTWLRRRIAEADRRDPGAERSRRLDSDARAVQIVTIHLSKGLEFPVVHVPFAWNRWVDSPTIALFHDESGRRTRDVGGPGGDGWAASVRAHQHEDDGEDLRLLYVAATRARSSLTLWWARSNTTTASAVHRVLFSPGDGAAPAARSPLPTDHAALTTMRARAAGSGGGLEAVSVTRRQTPAWAAPAPEQVEPFVAVFDRDLDLDWRRTSYSALTAIAHAVGDGVAHRLPESGEAQSPGTVDEPDPPAGGQDGPAAGTPAPPLAGLPGGTAFGTLVHEVLEVADPAEESTEALIEHCRRALARTPLADVSAEILGPALAVALRTPLGPLASGRALAEIGREDRLRELEFELPLAGGDRPGRSARLAQLAPVLAAHLAADDPLHEWLPRLQRPELAEQPLRGYLTGSIDVVLRIRPDNRGEPPRYVVVDYKTNRLHPQDVEATTAHYRSAALSSAMQAADYPLQALLYQVALHRYLTWRQPGYDPQLHLGGTLYLFLRGMSDVPQGRVGDDIPGVFAWRPPTAAILAVDELLAGG